MESENKGFLTLDDAYLNEFIKCPVCEELKDKQQIFLFSFLVDGELNLRFSCRCGWKVKYYTREENE